MEGIDKFIGIIHEYGKDTYDSNDCAGLCKLFHREVFGYVIDDYKPIGTVETSKLNPLRMLRWLLKNMDKVTDISQLTYGDIVLTKVFDEHHVAIFLKYNKVLTQEIPVIYGTTKSTIYRGQQWMPFFVMGFRRRKQC